ncbi:hypothetical protein LX32DRAFT_258294 [Colletotrichum zoysiae]|uniref:Uncharacterized protein n=1 Tax=Colletotrichum zoysiae TaxID=1216348 RepID=A0AAD9LUY2_9PEZI|nr:hypothetical protein LX32DRAFT_258294 [Colletotrichum zoysiae]
MAGSSGRCMVTFFLSFFFSFFLFFFLSTYYLAEKGDQSFGRAFGVTSQQTHTRLLFRVCIGFEQSSTWFRLQFCWCLWHVTGLFQDFLHVAESSASPGQPPHFSREDGLARSGFA